MRTIRSLLWIGTGDGLARSGLTEAPQLDVTWVPDLEAAETLPRVRFDGALLELRAAPDRDGLDARLRAIERVAPRDAMIATLPVEQARAGDGVLSLGLAAVLEIDDAKIGPGFVSELDAILDTICERRKQARSGPAAAPVAGDERAVGGAGSASAGADPPGQGDGAPDGGDTERPVVLRSEAIRGVFELVDHAASSPSTVLVTGETGVGKEVVARALHARSTREEEPFLGINCAAFPEHLLESELFGHARGSFTGADRAKRGLFEVAGHGTLFLDEIAETSLPLQAKLLRVLQEREVRPVGDARARPVHCRIVAATNRVLAEEVRAGRFREDLFYRLNVFPIAIPPLRERRADILPLARAFLAKHGPAEGKPDCHFSLAASHLLEAYRWPGNVRELENEILRALMLAAPRSLITPRQLSPKLCEILEPIADGARPEETLREALDRVEGWLLRRALANNGGRKARTAKRLGLTREGLYN